MQMNVAVYSIEKSCVISKSGIMYRMPFIIGKISPDRANRTLTRSEGVLLPTEGA